MGPAVSAQFCAEGATLALLGRDVDALHDVAASLDGEVAVWRCDVTQADDVDGVIAQVVDRFGHVDVLVNIAGGTGPVGATAWETTPQEFEEIVRLNMAGSFHTMRAVLPGMIARR
jgi:NADP-dependent 3-hydroxy acid dehydrogenase YdfG